MSNVRQTQIFRSAVNSLVFTTVIFSLNSQYNPLQSKSKNKDHAITYLDALEKKMKLSARPRDIME